MQSKIAFVDEVAIAREFATGDVVRKTDTRDLVLSPYVGRVVYSNLATGKVQVQWPWGEHQESPSELVKDTSGHFAPPLALDQGYSSWERSRWTSTKESEKSDAKWRKSLSTSMNYDLQSLPSKIASKYEDITLPLWKNACKLMHLGASEIDAYKTLHSEYSDDFGDDAIRLTISNLYEMGRRLAIYWKDSKRRYKVTQREKDFGQFTCPRCRGILKPRVYRQGRKILMCNGCGFTLHPKDLR